jgi:heat shock protein HtpX
LLPSAYASAQFLTRLLLQKRTLFREVTATEVVSLTMIALLAFAAALVFAYAGSAFISSVLLWHADARRASRDKEPDLFRTVENLCIGAGLPPPVLYIVESTSPNAFATGCDPAHASLVISRGLLRLLDERELAAVVAHELSHIGNHDTDFSTMLTALVATVRLPLKVVTAIAWLLSLLDNPESQEPDNEEGEQTRIAVCLVMFLVIMDAGLANVFAVEWNLRAIVAVASPIYVLVLAPGCATLLLRTMSQQRDFLADADAALLTRDPEGLALALAKIGGAIQFTPKADAATAHLYFVDPLPRASWLDGAHRSHPSIGARIALLARMTDGIPEAKLRSAADAGEKFRQDTPLIEAAPPTSPRVAGSKAATCEADSQARLTDSRTLLYEAANISSGVLAELDSNVLITIENLEPQFFRVRLVDDTVGYIPLSAGLMSLDDDPDGNPDIGVLELNGIHYRRRPSPLIADVKAIPATPFRLPGTQLRLTDLATPLYAKPDGWSDVVRQLSSGTVVTFNERVGAFARVAIDGAVGYISTSAHVDRLDTA